MTADHIIAHSERSQGFSGETCALVIKDHFSKDIGSYPLADKTAESARWAMSDFVGPNCRIGHIFTDNSPELKSAVVQLAKTHGRSTPGEPSTNGTAESAVGIVARGTRATLMHAGLPPCCWPWAQDYFCHSRRINLRDGESMWNVRHQKGHFEGKFIPFGVLVTFKLSPDDTKKLPKFASRSVPGVFLGWKLNPGCVWDKEYYCALLKDFDDVDLSVDVKSFSVEKRTTRRVHWDGKFVFPLKASYDKANFTLEGIQERSARVQAFGSEQPAEGLQPNASISESLGLHPSSSSAGTATSGNSGVGGGRRQDQVPTDSLGSISRGRTDAETKEVKGDVPVDSLSQGPSSSTDKRDREVVSVDPAISEVPQVVPDETEDMAPLSKRGAPAGKYSGTSVRRGSSRPPTVPSWLWKLTPYPERLKARSKKKRERRQRQRRIRKDLQPATTPLLPVAPLDPYRPCRRKRRDC